MTDRQKELIQQAYKAGLRNEDLPGLDQADDDGDFWIEHEDAYCEGLADGQEVEPQPEEL